MRAVIIGNGEITDYTYISGKLRKGDYIICADGGYRHSVPLGIKPDVLIGDMDSIGENDFDGDIINLPIRKDFTASEVCVKYVLLKDFEEILMLGFTGTRQDHTITNLLLLKQFAAAGKKAHITDEHNDIYFTSQENVIYGQKGDLVSIIPVGGDLRGICTTGLDYPLDNETLFFGESRGVSNVMTSNKCVIKIESGYGLIIKSRD